MSKEKFFSSKDDAKGPKQDNPGSSGKGKKITGGSGSGKEYKQVTKFGGKK